MIYIAICDDEKYFRERIEYILKDCMSKRGQECSIDSYGSGEEFKQLGASVLKYDLVFFDISMLEMDGVKAAQWFRTVNKEAFVVFVTSYIEYTLEGYKVDAIRYILKNNHTMDASIEECVDTVLAKIKYQAVKIPFDFMEGMKIISYERIMYVESRLHMVDFYVIEGEVKKYTLHSSMSVVEKLLKDGPFIRPHQSYLVNVKYIKKLVRYNVVLINEKSIPIPRARYDEIMGKYIAYKGEM